MLLVSLSPRDPEGLSDRDRRWRRLAAIPGTLVLTASRVGFGSEAPQAVRRLDAWRTVLVGLLPAALHQAAQRPAGPHRVP
jgi:hypothetical protein